MHCFSGDAGLRPGLPGPRRVPVLRRHGHLQGNTHLREALATAPLDRVLVETDAPYLTPMPFRGRPNASYLIPHTARLMAEVRGDDLARLCRALDANAEAAFGGPWPALME